MVVSFKSFGRFVEIFPDLSGECRFFVGATSLGRLEFKPSKGFL